MPLSHLPPFLSHTFAAFAHWLDRRTAARLPLLLYGVLFASGRRTATSWFRAGGITVEFRDEEQRPVNKCTVGLVARRRRNDNVSVSSVAFRYSQMPRSRWERAAANMTHVNRSRSFSVARRIRMLMRI